VSAQTWPTSDDARRFGFEWGPMRVVRAVHIEGRGRVIVVATDHAEMEVFVSEKGRKIRAYEKCLCGCEGGRHL